MEMRIPVAAMNTRVRAGAKWRVNFYRADGRGDDSQRRFLAWSPVMGTGTFHVPTRFGLIEFTK
jgi:hypothetical protein